MHQEESRRSYKEQENTKMVRCEGQIILDHRWCCPVFLPLLCCYKLGCNLTPIWPYWPFPSLIMDLAQLWALGTEFVLEDLTVWPLTSTGLSSPRVVCWLSSKQAQLLSLLTLISASQTLPATTNPHQREKCSCWGNFPVGLTQSHSRWMWITHQWISTAEKHGGAICCWPG